MLSRIEQDKIISLFPYHIKSKLSHVKHVHKKVHSDYYVAIPYGKKYFIWFTYYLDKPVCVLLEVKCNTQILSARMVCTCFEDGLANNTILYGTLQNRLLFIENIFRYKDCDVADHNDIDKWKIIRYMFNKDIKQVSLTTSDFIMTMPVMKLNFTDLMTVVPALPYKVYSIDFRALTKKLPILRWCTYNVDCLYPTLTFSVRANIQNDIYDLFLQDSGDNVYDVAHIPDYKTSVMMNNLFRNIKENANLDTLEESDDDEEFQNPQHVDMEKTYLMECKYNKLFNKWVPLYTAKSNAQMASIATAQKFSGISIMTK